MMVYERPILLDVPAQFGDGLVVVRPYTDDDAVAVQDAIEESREHLKPYLPFYLQDLDDTREFIRRAQSRFLLREGFEMGMFAPENSRFLGGMGLSITKWGVPSFELGYWARLSAEGHGYVTSAARLLTRFAFDKLEAERVVIRCDSRNARSRAVAERLGFVYEGCFRRDSLDTTGSLRDTLTLAMIRDDYRHARENIWPRPSL